MTREQLRETEVAAKRSMIIFQEAVSHHSQALHLGIDEDVLVLRERAHDALDAYFDHLRVLHGAQA